MAGDDLVIAGRRIRLRPLQDEDVPLILPWYGEAAAAAHGLRDGGPYGSDALLAQIEAARAETQDGPLVVLRRDGPEPIGLLDYRADVPEVGLAMIRFVALAAWARRWGLGVEAVLVFEEEAVRRWGLRGFRADVDIRHGLAVYFWLRLGYRPLGVGADWQGHEALRMARDA